MFTIYQDVLIPLTSFENISPNEYDIRNIYILEKSAKDIAQTLFESSSIILQRLNDSNSKFRINVRNTQIYRIPAIEFLNNMLSEFIYTKNSPETFFTKEESKIEKEDSKSFENKF